MRGFTGYLLIGVLAVLTMGTVTVAGLGVTVGARPVSERGAIVQHVDRTNKGDRLNARTIVGTERSAPKRQIALPVGCEPAFSPLESAGHPNITGRCVS
jgi:hypothetical protein